MFNRFAAGKKVYGQGSYAPTRGQVNPQGYIQREIKNRNQQALAGRGGVSRVGNDGQSDTRSGIAKRLLGNKGSSAGAGRPPRAVVTNSGGGNSARPKTTRSPSPGITRGPGITAGVRPPVSVVQANPTGQLQLPYGSEFANQALDAQMAYDAEILALQGDEQENESAYASNSRDLEQGYTNQQRGTLNENASSGTAFSSAMGVGVNEDSRLYNNSKNDLLSGYTNFKTGLGNRKNQASTALRTMLQRAQQGYADQLAQEAAQYASEQESIRAQEEAIAATAAATAAPAANVSWDHATDSGGWGAIANWGDDDDKKGKGRPPRPSPKHFWRDGKWKKL